MHYIIHHQWYELLQIKNKGKIVFVNAGNFYIAVGKDAVLVHKILDLKTTCMKPEICKAGFPINSLEKYTEKLSESKYSFIVYYFNQETEELKEVIVMNLCFLIGKIISEINFKFVLNSKNISKDCALNKIKQISKRCCNSKKLWYNSYQ